MALISFSGEPKRGPFWALILNEEKRQTVRHPRKVPIRVGDTLHFYWKVRTPIAKKEIHKIGTAICTAVEKVLYRDFRHNDAFAYADGFVDAKELRKWFGFTWGDEPFEVIHWGELLEEDESALIEKALKDVNNHVSISKLRIKTGLDGRTIARYLKSHGWTRYTEGKSPRPIWTREEVTS